MNKPDFYKSGHLNVDNNHQIWYGLAGNPDGIPILVMNGGPGGQSKPKYLAPYDLERFNVIMFDQRGAGQSMFKDLLKNNTTQDLVEDAKKLLDHLGFEKLIVAGPSWGSTLAIEFAGRYPEMVEGLFLSAIFPARKEDLDWMHLSLRKIFPEVNDHKIKFLKDNSLEESGYYDFVLDRFQNGNWEEKQKVCAAVASIEGNMMKVGAEMGFLNPEEIEDDDVQSTLIFMHYEKNNFFLGKEGVFTKSNLVTIKNIPTTILHGRYDVLTTVSGAYELHKNQNNSILEIVTDEGHAFSSDSKKLNRYMLERLLNMVG